MEQQIYDGEKAFIAPDVIISMITEGNKKVGEVLNHPSLQLITSDFALYEAVSSINKKELIMSALTKFLLRVQIVSSPKINITFERIEHLRGVAKLKKWKNVLIAIINFTKELME